MENSAIDENGRRFLERLHEDIGGDLQRAISMYDLGAALGLDREAAADLAHDLMAAGHVEVRTLAGDIGLTPSGLELVTAAMDGNDPESGAVTLDDAPLLSPEAAQAVDELVTQLKSCFGDLGLDFEQGGQWMADVQCLQVQLAAPQPKTAVIRALLQAVLETAESLPGNNTVTAVTTALRKLLGS